jgi:putative alpha-1,2-mannosidase
MAKYCISLALILLFTGSVLAGTPVHSGEQHCAMTGKDDCCAKAQSQDTTPEVFVARLCCSLNCTAPGTTGPNGTTNISPSTALALSSAIMPPSASVETTGFQRAYSFPERNEHSPPIYIQHLALLI